MATTTPNFGWPVPTSTDLVKDGATAIEALGDGIDTSMVDLKGGLTGQILAKATNADMDFSWITNDVGDITAVTAGTGLTGGGTSGAVSLAFDQANFGGGQFAAGKNKIINGNFGVWQRGTNFVNPSVNAYTADRWVVVTNHTGGTVTMSRQAFTGTDIPVAGAEYYFRTVGSSPTGQTFYTINQKIENVQTFAGQTVTLSFYAKADAARNITPAMYQIFGTGGSSATTTTGSAIALTTSWARYSQTFSIPSISGKTIGTNSHLQFEFTLPNNVASSTIDFYGIQIEAGSFATPFQTATGTIQGELAVCKRYLPSVSPADVIGYAYGTNTPIWSFAFDVQARIAPTGLSLVGGGTFQGYALNTGSAVTPAFNLATVSGASVTAGLTIIAGQGSRLQAQGTATILFTGCEL